MINATDFHTYYQLVECPRRLWLDANRPDLKAPPSEFDQLLFRKGREHEQAHLATFSEYARPAYRPGDLAAGAAATARLLSEGTAVIYQGVLMSPDRGLAGIPDFLIREGDTYLVREVKLALNLDRHPEIPAQIGLYSHILQTGHGVSVPRGEVLLGNGELVLLDPIAIGDLVGRLAAIKATPDEPDEAVGWSKCQPCAFFDYCWNAAIQARDPAVVAGIEQGLRHALLRAGIRRYDGLATVGVDQLADMRFQQKTRERKVGEKTAEKVLRQVAVLMSGQMQIVCPPQLPSAGPVVYFDIESNPLEADLDPIVYLWGLLVDRAGRAAPEYWGGIASPGTEGDASAWQAFLAKAADVFRELGDVPFVHYAAYEKTWTRKYIERWGDRDGIGERVLGRLVDLYPTITGSLCLPVHSYGLKQVEKYAGFQRQQVDYGSLWSVARYNAYLETADEAERKAIEGELLTYNEEDCVAMRHVLKWAARLRRGA